MKQSNSLWSFILLASCVNESCKAFKVDNSFIAEASPSFAYKLDTEHFDDAVDFCESNIFCAGISASSTKTNSTLNNHTTDSEDYFAFSFLPSELESVFQSYRNFTIHNARIINGKRKIISNDYGITLERAKEKCLYNSKCVAFFYSVYSPRLNVIKKVTFVSTIEAMEESPENEWRTYIVNDANRATYIDESSLEYFTTKDSVFNENQPYRSCCKHEEIPSVDEIRAADTFERVSCDIPREEFRRLYEDTRTPVMLVGCDKHWAAKKKWTSDQFWQRFDNSTIWRETVASEDKEDEEAENTPFETIRKFNNDGKRFYIFDQLDHAHGKSLEGDYEIPQPIQNGNLFANLTDFPDNEYGSLRWFCLGNGETGTLPHDDPHTTDAWNSVLQGHKWWILYPNTVKNSKTVECDETCSIKSDNTAKLWFGSVAVNAMRTEYAPHGQKPIVILQSPGETIYVPNGYIHAVFNLDETIAVTANFGSMGNLINVWRQMLDTPIQSHPYQAYYTIFDKHQRRLIRESPYWPIEQGRALRNTEISDNDEDEDDSSDANDEQLNFDEEESDSIDDEHDSSDDESNINDLEEENTYYIQENYFDDQLYLQDEEEEEVQEEVEEVKYIKDVVEYITDDDADEEYGCVGFNFDI